MWELFKDNLLWTAGVQIMWCIALCAAISFMIFPRFLYVLATFFLFSFYFFRNPKRVCHEALQSNTVLVCPADGKVVDVQQNYAHSGPEYTQKVSIFLSPLDVHVNWVPFSGSVTNVTYKSGTFKLAFLPKSSEYNERNEVHFKDMQGRSVMVRQIAGTVARRICCWVKKGENVHVGNKFGMIRFGSRVDILLPASVNIAVNTGQRVYGGQTVLGEWS